MTAAKEHDRAAAKRSDLVLRIPLKLDAKRDAWFSNHNRMGVLK